MAYFTPSFAAFFRELAANNRKEWLDEHRDRYMRVVREPFTAFVREMIARFGQIDPEIELDPKDAVFRINNDIRFNPDKPLYKNHMAAVISKYGRKRMDYPGFYFQLGPEMVGVAGGSHRIGKKHLGRVRQAIAGDPGEFHDIINDRSFTEAFGELRGEENKRLPPDLKEAGDRYPVIYKKQFYYWAEEDASLIADEKLPDVLVDYYRAGKPLSDWLASHYPGPGE